MIDMIEAAEVSSTFLMDDQDQDKDMDRYRRFPLEIDSGADVSCYVTIFLHYHIFFPIQ